MLIESAIHHFAVYLKAAGRSEKTIRSYKERLQKLLHFSNKTKLKDIIADDLDDYIVSLRDTMSVSSVAGYTQAIKAFFRWCVLRGYITSSPAVHLKKTRMDFSARNKAIRDVDFQAMLSRARLEERKMETAILMFLMDTGCRAGELCSLNINDIDFEQREAYVRGKTGIRILDFTQPTVCDLQ